MGYLVGLQLRFRRASKNRALLKAVCICLVLFSIPLAACASSAEQEEKVTTTTIDPQILELQEKVETLESILNTTTTTIAAKPVKTIVRTYRFSSNTRFDQHECREIAEYSDGTQVEISRWWAQSNDTYPRYPC